MKQSTKIAAGIAGLSILWIASGLIIEGDGVPTEVDPNAAVETPIPVVRVQTIKASDKYRELSLFGRSEADRKVVLRAETAGQVAEVRAAKGARLSEGEVIAKLDLEDRPALLDEARAVLEQRRMEYTGGKELSEKQFRSKVKLAENKAALESAQAALKRIAVDIENATIHAPFDGILDSRTVEVGDFVSVGGEVGVFVDLDPIVVVAEVTERNVSDVKVGAPARVTFADGRETIGFVRFVSSVGEPTTRTFRTEVEVPNPDADIAEGLTAELNLSLERVSAHRMSSAVLTLSDEGILGVKIVGDDMRVAFKPVRVVADSRDGVWLQGLPDDVRVITVGQEFVRPGQEVRVVEAPLPSSKPDPAAATPVGQ